MRLFIRDITGLDNIPKKGPYLVAANHSSYLDNILVYSLFYLKANKRLHFLAKKEYFENFLEKSFYEFFDSFPVDRKTGGKEGLEIALRNLKQGNAVGVFPEGTRTLTGKTQRGKTGVVRLALWARVPIVPVGIDGTYKILPKGKTIPSYGKIYVNIGKPVYLDEYYDKKPSRELYRKLTNRLMKRISILAGQTTKRIYI